MFLVAVQIIPTSARPDDWYVDGTLGTDDETHGTGPGADAFKTIQYAINDTRVSTGDTIIVAAETYNEQVRFAKNVTVTSSTGEAVSGGVVIDPNGTEFEGPVSGHMVRAAVTFEAGSSGSVLRGVIIENSYASDYTPENYGGNSGIEVIDGGIDKVVVQNVIANNVAGHGFGSYDTNHPWPPPSGWLIDNCSFSTTDTDTWSGMRPENMDNLTIQDCDIGPTNYGGILLINVNNAVVQRNKVHNTVRAGIQVDSYCTGTVDIVDKEVWATNSANKTDYGGVRLYGQHVPDPHGDAAATVTIQGNLLHDGYNSICVKTGQNISTRTVMVRENSIFGHSNYGALNAGTGLLDAKYNWWGDASGPNQTATNPSGLGDKVTDNVTYSPWLGFVAGTSPMAFHVNPTGTIQEAIDAASPGDTIIVAAGTYAGAIVDKDVTISGASGGASIITSGVPYKTGSSLYTAFRLDDTADGAEIKDFTINISVANVTDLWGWEFELFYSSTHLNGTDAQEGPFLKTAGETFFWVVNFTDNYNATHGYIYAFCILTHVIPGADGTGVIANVTFKSKAHGSSILDLTGTKLKSSGGDYIPHGTYDGTVIVGKPGDANGDGEVDTVDLSMLGRAWDTSEAVPHNELLGTDYDPNCDFNDDTAIGTPDLSIMGKYWQSDP